MYKKLMFLISLVCLLVLAGSARAEDADEADLWVHPGDSCSISGTVTLAGGFWVDVGATLTVTGTLTCEGDDYRPMINGGTLIVDGGTCNFPVRVNIGDGEGGTINIINGGTLHQWDGDGKDSDEGIKFPDNEGGENRVNILDGTLQAYCIEQKHDRDAVFTIGLNGQLFVEWATEP